MIIQVAVLLVEQPRQVACEFGCAPRRWLCGGQDHSIQGSDLTDEQGPLTRDATPWFDVYTLVKVINVETKDGLAHPRHRFGD